MDFGQFLICCTPGLGECFGRSLTGVGLKTVGLGEFARKISKNSPILNLKSLLPATGWMDRELAKRKCRKDSDLSFETGLSIVGGVVVVPKRHKQKKPMAI